MISVNPFDERLEYHFILKVSRSLHLVAKGVHVSYSHYVVLGRLFYIKHKHCYDYGIIYKYLRKNFYIL